MSEGDIDTGQTVGGEGWYRKELTLAGSDADKRIVLYFEGVYNQSELWINGKKANYNVYGYTSYRVDITPYLNAPGTPNVIAMKVVNAGRNSRWYAGSGIFRHVWLIKTNKLYLDKWDTFVDASELQKKEAVIQFSTIVHNEGLQNQSGKIGIKIYSPAGNEVFSTSQDVILSEGTPVATSFSLKKPELWSVDTPVLYTAEVSLSSDGKEYDKISVPFGIRTLSFSAEKGFLLNGKSMKLKGGCVHHDNGLLGAAAIDRAEERKVELMKANGYNAVRCAHNQVSEYFLDACDRLGMLVIHETFDQWQKAKREQDYHQFFDEWSDWDLAASVRRDRNHPSIIMWSIGNEIKDKETAEVVEVCRELTGFVKTLDTTRPVTAGVNSIVDATDDFLAPLDVCGYNYCLNRYESDAKRHPDRIIYASESYASQAYDYWKGVEDHSWVIGDFIWTAFDYIGEASIGWCGYPLDKRIFPWNHANCGDLNLSGERRPQSYLRETLWSDAPVSHIVVTPPVPSFPLNPNKADWSVWDFPDVVDHWNFPGYEGKKMTVSVYSNCEQVELFLNGESLGKQENTADKKNTLVWEVPYAHGILKAVSYNKGGEVGTATLESAGKVEKIRLSADRTEIVADGNDLSYITLELVDSKGIRNQLAEELVEFSIAGDATIEGVGNANPMSIESFVANSRKTWRGSNLLVVRSGKSSGRIIVTAKVKALPVASITITQKK